MALFHDSTGRRSRDVVGRSLSRGQGGLSGLGCQLVRGCGICGVSRQEPARHRAVLEDGAGHSPSKFIEPVSNGSDNLAPVGKFDGLGPYGTYDLIGNAREWDWNATGEGLRFLLGRLDGLVRSGGAVAIRPLRPQWFSLRRQRGELPEQTRAPLKLLQRDWSTAKPASDDVFAAYRAMYAYDKTPLDAKVEAASEDSERWTRQKITFKTAYGNERMTAYLFLPKRVKPPYQVVVFFPSARVNGLPSSDALGDLSLRGLRRRQRARGDLSRLSVPLRAATRRAAGPGSDAQRETLIAWSKDLGRSLDYLATRDDIDMTRVGYLGVSQGAADGVILAALEDRIEDGRVARRRLFSRPPSRRRDGSGRLRAAPQEARADGQWPLRLDVSAPERRSNRCSTCSALRRSKSAMSCSTRRTTCACDATTSRKKCSGGSTPTSAR